MFRIRISLTLYLLAFQTTVLRHRAWSFSFKVGKNRVIVCILSYFIIISVIFGENKSFLDQLFELIILQLPSLYEETILLLFFPAVFFSTICPAFKTKGQIPQPFVGDNWQPVKKALLSFWYHACEQQNGF